MSKGCPYPDCILDDWHDGDHEFDRSKPYGALKLISTFSSMTTRCDICPELPAKAFFADERKKGWALCGWCIEEHGANTELGVAA